MTRFNPRPRTGGDSMVRNAGMRDRLMDMGYAISGFNPRPRTGGDIARGPSPTSTTRFNPRPRTGGDLKGAVPLVVRSGFQSAPPHGGRP